MDVLLLPLLLLLLLPALPDLPERAVELFLFLGVVFIPIPLLLFMEPRIVFFVFVLKKKTQVIE